MRVKKIKLKCILVAILFTSINLKAQITINNVVGDYICNVNHGTSIIPYCSGTKLSFIKHYNSLYPSCDTSLIAHDSGCINNYGLNNPFDAIINIFTDSTLHDCSRSNLLLGKFYSYDSIYLKIIDYPNPGYYEYFGKKVHPPVGLPEIGVLNMSFEIYPNPADDKVYLSSTEPQKNINIVLYNTFGEICANKNNTTEIDVSGLPDGIYFLCIQTENAVENIKVVVQH